VTISSKELDTFWSAYKVIETRVRRRTYPKSRAFLYVRSSPSDGILGFVLVAGFKLSLPSVLEMIRKGIRY
jgi:hypothetical protein